MSSPQSVGGPRAGEMGGGTRNRDQLTGSLPQPSRPRPTPSVQIKFGVLDALKTLLELVDQVLQDSLARIQIRMPDPVGVLGVELVGLRHAAGVLTSSHPHRHLGGSPFHQQIAMKVAMSVPNPAQNQL